MVWGYVRDGPFGAIRIRFALPSMIYEALDRGPVKHATYADGLRSYTEIVASDAPASGALRPLSRRTADWPREAPEARVRWCPAKFAVDCLAAASSSTSPSPPRTGGATPPAHSIYCPLNPLS